MKKIYFSYPMVLFSYFLSGSDLNSPRPNARQQGAHRSRSDSTERYIAAEVRIFEMTEKLRRGAVRKQERRNARRFRRNELAKMAQNKTHKHSSSSSSAEHTQVTDYSESPPKSDEELKKEHAASKKDFKIVHSPEKEREHVRLHALYTAQREQYDPHIDEDSWPVFIEQLKLARALLSPRNPIESPSSITLAFSLQPHRQDSHKTQIIAPVPKPRLAKLEPSMLELTPAIRSQYPEPLDRELKHAVARQQEKEAEQLPGVVSPELLPKDDKPVLPSRPLSIMVGDHPFTLYMPAAPPTTLPPQTSVSPLEIAEPRTEETPNPPLLEQVGRSLRGRKLSAPKDQRKKTRCFC